MGKSNENFKRICKEKGVKVIDVSRGTGISNSTLYEWCRGLYTPKIDKLTKIAEFLKVDVNELIDDDKVLENRIPTSNIASDCVELIDYYSKLNGADKELIIDMVKNLAERESLLKKYMGISEDSIS